MSINFNRMPIGDQDTAKIVKFFQTLDRWSRELEDAIVTTKSKVQLPNIHPTGTNLIPIPTGGHA